jgi:hypothetical protein
MLAVSALEPNQTGRRDTNPRGPKAAAFPFAVLLRTVNTNSNRVGRFQRRAVRGCFISGKDNSPVLRRCNSLRKRASRARRNFQPERQNSARLRRRYQPYRLSRPDRPFSRRDYQNEMLQPA